MEGFEGLKKGLNYVISGGDISFLPPASLNLNHDNPNFDLHMQGTDPFQASRNAI